MIWREAAIFVEVFGGGLFFLAGLRLVNLLLLLLLDALREDLFKVSFRLRCGFVHIPFIEKCSNKSAGADVDLWLCRHRLYICV